MGTVLEVCDHVPAASGCHCHVCTRVCMCTCLWVGVVAHPYVHVSIASLIPSVLPSMLCMCLVLWGGIIQERQATIFSLLLCGCQCGWRCNAAYTTAPAPVAVVLPAPAMPDATSKLKQVCIAHEAMVSECSLSSLWN